MAEPTPASGLADRPALLTIAREWGRIGCLGFGGPPAHIAMLRELCIERRGWLTEHEFEDANAAANLLPGPASTQLAIFCGWRVRGIPGALIAAAGFILPGLAAILALAVVFLSDPPQWVRAAGAGAGAAVAAVALQAGWGMLPPSWSRASGRYRRRWVAYTLAGAAATIALGPRLVMVLIGLGLVELCWRGWTRQRDRLAADGSAPLALLATGAAAAGGLGAVAWVALKVGALSYGGGFVIIPLMQADAVEVYGWMTGAEFLNAVALGQVTPGPVTHTVAVVGYAAAGWSGALLAAAVAFAPSLAFIVFGAGHFDRLRANANARAFLDGAGPAAIGAVLGSAVPLALALSETWQFVVLAAATAALLIARAGVVLTLILAGVAGVVAVQMGAPVVG